MKRLLIALGFCLFFGSVAKAAATTDYLQYGATTAFICSGFNGLANSATVGVACSSVTDTGSTPAVDAFVTVTATNTSGAPATPYAVQVYVYGSADNNIFESDLGVSPAAGGSYTINGTASTNFHLAAQLNIDTAGKSATRSFSVANLYGGVLPKWFGLVIINQTGQTLGASGNTASYSLVNYKNQ